MLIKSLDTKDFREVMSDNISRAIEYMFDNNQEFAVACELDNVKFTPELPLEIKDSIPDVTLFMLANYSFESALIDSKYLSFETGFGSENFGALVQIPLLAIKQIVVENYPILINITSYIEPIEEEEETTEEFNSMSALLSNPENAKLLKKR